MSLEERHCSNSKQNLRRARKRTDDFFREATANPGSQILTSLSPDEAIGVLAGDGKAIQREKFARRVEDYRQARGDRSVPQPKYFEIPFRLPGEVTQAPASGNLHVEIDLPVLWQRLFSEQVPIGRQLLAKCPRHPESRTLRMFPEADGDYTFHCHLCGACYSAAQLFRFHMGFSSMQLALEGAVATGVFRSPPSLEWQKRIAQSDFMMHHFSRQTAAYERLLADEAIPSLFGEWAWFDIASAVRAQILATNKKWHQKHSSCLVRLSRSISGRPALLHVFSSNLHYYCTKVLSSDRATFVFASWSMYSSRERELILCLNQETAAGVGQAVAQWPHPQRTAVAWTDIRSEPPVLDNNPWSRYQVVASPVEEWTDALPFSETENSTIRLLPESVRDLSVPSFFEAQPSLPIPLAVANQIGPPSEGFRPLTAALQRPYLSHPVARSFIQAYCQHWRLPLKDTAQQLQSDFAPLSCITRNNRFFAKNGQYWSEKYNNRSRIPITNFVVTILQRYPDYLLELQVEGSRVQLCCSHEQFHKSSRQLLALLRNAALKNGLAEPLVNAGHYHSLLQNIILWTNPF